MSGEPLEQHPEVTLDRLAGEWWIYQLRRGQRYATDDVLVAWAGTGARPGARRVLDLGCGVGAVGLLALLRLGPKARLTGVELQQRSLELALRTVAHNGLQQQVELRHGDLRDPALLAGAGPFELVLANPPYLPPGSALTSPHPQRAAARMELHGDVFDYCRAAARVLAPGGCLCFCHAAGDPRPERAVAEAGLALRSRQEVLFRAGRPPTIALHCCAAQGPRQDPAPLVVRAADGQRTVAFRQVRREMSIEA
jgi:tRNA1(Val) A37 N6-methylase TrmN6